MKVSACRDAIDLSRILYLRPRARPPALLLLILRKRSTGFHDAAGAGRELLEISNANAKEVEPRQLSLRSYRGLSLYGRSRLRV